MRRTPILPAALCLLAACSGDASPTGGGNPPPVASITFPADSLQVVPGEAAQLVATLRDGNGNALTGRTITWSSAAPGVATVSGTGLVTALVAGSALVTATCEGKTATVRVIVAGGGYIATNGGVATSSDSTVRVVVPSGALPGGTAITITQATTLPTPPDGATPVRGAVYHFGPDGLRFATPATVAIRYDPAQLPRWVIPGDLVLMRWDGTQWSRLTNLVVDSATRTVTGRVPGFSTVGVYFLNPVVTLTPSPGRINHQQRSVTLQADVSGNGRLPGVFQYTWTNTASNGSLTHTNGSTAQYTALSPILPPGDLDGISVTMRGQFVPNGPFEDLGSAQTTVTSDLALSVQVAPTRSVVQYGQSVDLGVQVFDIAGNQPYTGNPYLRYYWTSTSTSGSFNLPPGRITLGRGTYTAYPASQQSSAPTKGDNMSVHVKLVNMRLVPTPITGKFLLDSSDTDIGDATAYVQVIPQHQVKLTPVSTQLQAGQSVTLQAALQPAWAGTEQLFYQYRTSGSQGTLSVNTGVPLTQSSVTYTAAAKPSGGTDYVDVDILAGFAGRIGTARAVISVQARSDTVKGALVVTPPVALDPGRQCVVAYIAFPLVPGALTYDMTATGFNDTAYWGTSIEETINASAQAYVPCSLSGFGSSGVSGNEYRFFLSGAAGPSSSIGQAISSMNARFAGMQVQVIAR